MPVHVIAYLHDHVSVPVCIPTDGCWQSVRAQAHGWAHKDMGGDKKMSPNDQKEEQQKARHGIRVL